MSDSLTYYLQGLLATGFVLEVGQLSRRSGSPSIRKIFLRQILSIVPLVAFFLVGVSAPGSRSPASLLTAACGIVLAGRALVAVTGIQSSLLRFVPVFLGLAFLVRCGFTIPFVSAPGGGLVYLGSWALPLTLIYSVLLASSLWATRILPGLFEGTLAMLSYLYLGALGLQALAPESLYVMALTFAGVTTALWLYSHRTIADGGLPLGDSDAASACWIVIAVALSVWTTSKRLVVLALAPLTLLALAPIVVFTFLIAKSYLGPRLTGARGERIAFRWNLTRESLVTMLLVFCLVGNLMALVVSLTNDPFLWGGLALVASMVLARLLTEMARPGSRQRAPGVRPETVEVLGARLWSRGSLELVESISRRLDSGHRLRLITPDSLALLRSLSDPEYRDRLAQADYLLPDGAGVVWAGDFLHEEPVLDQIPGCDFIESLAQLANKRGQSLYLLGAAPGVADKAAKRLQDRYPGLVIAGTRDGYFTQEQESSIVEAVNSSGAHFLLVGLGVPHQEAWIGRNHDRLATILEIGVGGSFDVLSGEKLRAPPQVQRLGLEWLYRVFKEPQRLPRIIHLPRFVLEVIRRRLAQ